MSTLKVNEVRNLSNSGTANIQLDSNATTNLQTTTTLGLTVGGTISVSGVATFTGDMVLGNASTDTVQLKSKVTGFDNFSGFTGEMRMYAGNDGPASPPTGWLYCNGDTISSTTGNGGTHYNADGKGNDYQPLFNLLKAGNNWGNSGSRTWGSNVVILPDFRSRAAVGVHTGAANAITLGLTSRAIGATAGTETHALSIAELAAHTHVMTNPSSTTGMSASHAHTHTMPTHIHNFSGTQLGTHSHIAYIEGGFASSNRITNQSGPSSTGGLNGNAHSYLAHAVESVTAGTPAGSISATDPGDTNGISTATVTLVDPQHNHISVAATTGSGTAHTILQPIIAVNYIIKV